jgi:hypothetical protein
VWLQIGLLALLGTSPQAAERRVDANQVVATPAVAEEAFGAEPTRVSTWSSVYSADGMLITSQLVSASASPTPKLRVTVVGDMDIISGASVDVRTAASPRGYEERRTGGQVDLSYRPTTTLRVGASYVPSFEPDYRSHGVAARASAEWMDRRVMTTFMYRASFDEVGRVDSPSQWRPLNTHAASAELGIVVDKLTLFQAALEGQFLDGFQASPYRFVPVFWGQPGMGPPSVALAEAVPEQRLRGAVALSLRRALGSSWFASGGYRFYADTWAVNSHTGELEVQHAAFDDRLLVGVATRFYWQSAASFYRQQYAFEGGSVPQYRSADKHLSDAWSVLAGVRAEYALLRNLRLAARFDWQRQRFLSFTPLPVRIGVVGSAGLTASF